MSLVTNWRSDSRNAMLFLLPVPLANSRVKRLRAKEFRWVEGVAVVV